VSATGARLYDGRSARPHAVTARLVDDRLLLSADGAQLWSWRLAAMHILPGGAQPGFAHADDAEARLVVEDAVLARHIAAAVRAHGRPARLRRAGFVAAVGLAVPAALAALLWWGVPLAARPIAALVPASWERALGRQAVERIAGEAPACTAAAGRAALDRLVGRLLPRGLAAADLHVRVIARPVRNAFAAPGGEVVLFAGLLAGAGSAEEVAGVLAHELAHVRLGHPMQRAVQVFGIGLAVQALTGSDTLAGAAGSAATHLLVAAYSREDERAADRMGLETLAEAGIAADGIAAFFRGNAGRGDGPPAWLSTHPPDAERLAAIERALALGGGPAMSEADWRALKAICQ